ncbi:TonB-dependent receptor [Sphingomonas sp. R-74633]|uniref:TonB-dependent receptor n=1 Tax=Sphingomonas sp. R-74633 TaxID=2751188 RepID=UPI0015D3FABE|nr:TonB-dependent receptor [Sphingomonas sp. R-74633]NYT42681.1 TonB-dependent receptor [Sphingomonas sp. R-74633]
MRTKLFAGVAFAALMVPASAFAQSTGSADFEGEEIVVTGSRVNTNQITIPDVPKSRVTVGAETISHQRPGQTVNEIINLVPGVSFQNNDATGAAGGTFTIRGFDSSRISQTLDGIPLNDTGNYAIYTNQQQDPETLDSVSVNLGTTDVDSPTASAVGGTVNIRTRVPSETFGGMLSGTYGDYIGIGNNMSRPMFRVFGMVDTGDIAHSGVRAFFSASNLEARQPFNNYGKLKKQQYNFRLYKSLGDNGDFVSLGGQYNENRNNFFGSVPLRTDSTQSNTNLAARIVGPNSANRFPHNRDERFYNINYPCQINTAARPGLADVPSAAPAAPTAGASCGQEFDRRYNPSNTGSLRFGSRFSLSDKLTFTLDASYQYTKANGGGTVSLLESKANLSQTAVNDGMTGVINTGPNTGNFSPAGFGYYVGRDLNGDGDTLDTILGVAPSQTQTRRFGAVAGLAYDLDDNNRVRLNYTFDYGRHRQTGEAGYVMPNGEPFDVFPVNDPILDATGAAIEKRDRKSIAMLNQVSGEYRGQFLDEKLIVNIGVRAPFFQRRLDQRCFTVAGNGNVSCVSPSQTAAYQAANPYTFFGPGVTTVGAVARPTTGSCAITTRACVVGFAPPQKREFNYNRALPNIGLTYKFGDGFSVYASYAKGLSVPGTDNLYNSFYYASGSEQATPKPETTDSFDLGLRYNSGKIQAQLASWYTKFQNRTVSVYDIESDTSIYRNLGKVDKYGFDASISYRPTRDLLVYAFTSYLHSKIQDNIEAGVTSGGVTNYFQTAGKREGGSPDWTFGGRVQGTVGLFDLGVQSKYTGGRFVNDENLPVYACAGTISGGLCPTASQYQIYTAKMPAYAVVDLDVRFNFGQLLDGNKTYFQLNVSNLFDRFYVGGLTGSSGFVGLPNRYSIGNAIIGTPRSITGSIVMAF